MRLLIVREAGLNKWLISYKYCNNCYTHFNCSECPECGSENNQLLYINDKKIDEYKLKRKHYIRQQIREEKLKRILKKRI